VSTYTRRLRLVGPLNGRAIRTRYALVPGRPIDEGGKDPSKTAPSLRGNLPVYRSLLRIVFTLSAFHSSLAAHGSLMSTERTVA